MWVVHWGLPLRLPWRTWVCPCEGQVWRWCSCLGLRGSGSTRYSGKFASRAAGNIVLKKGMATIIGQYTPVFFPGECSWQRSLAHHSLQSRKELDTMQPCMHRCKIFFFFACVSSAESWACLAFRDPDSARVQGHRLRLQLELWPWKWKSLNHVQLFATMWNEACQSSLSKGFSRQEYWSVLANTGCHTLLE